MTAGVHFVRAVRPDKPIRWYIYAWRGGPKIRVAEQPTKPRLTREDIAAIAAAQAVAEAPKDTIHGLSTAWQRSRDWKLLAPSTRDTWGLCLGTIETKWGTVPLRLFGDPRMTPKLVKWRDALAVQVPAGKDDKGKRTPAKGGPRTADEHLKVLSLMLTWGQLRGLVACNVAAPVPRLWQSGNREEIIWLPEDCAAFDAVAPQWLRDARRLAEFTGLRRADLVALRWDEITETHIARSAAKKSRGKRRRTIMPIVPGLRTLLEELKARPRPADSQTVLVGAKGQPVKAATLTAEFISYRNKANDGQGIWHRSAYDDEADEAKTLHDIRGTFATKLMTLPGGSLTDDQIATVMGWTTKQVAAIRKRYVDEAAIVVAIGKRIAEAL